MSGSDDMSIHNLADWAQPHVEAGLLIGSFDILFWAFKQACVASASGMSPPSEWVSQLETYLGDPATPSADADAIRAGWNRSPSYYSGGLVLSLNANAGAMTLDDCVFVGSGSWDPNTYVHEMVHVGQYGAYGPEAFLAAYFGSSAIEIVRRWAAGEPTDPMTSSYLETEAYAIGNRFDPAHAR
jgi:hypothetical protein